MIEILIGWMTKPDYGWTLRDKVVIILEVLTIISLQATFFCVIYNNKKHKLKIQKELESGKYGRFTNQCRRF